jgi:DNA-binding NarL/FixJ family response regulator
MLDFSKHCYLYIAPMSIFVIDEHPLMREAIGTLIRRLHHAAVVVEVENLAAVTAAATTHGTPELICLELQQQATDGSASIQTLKTQFPDTPLVVLTALPLASVQGAALQAGASAVLGKSSSSAELGTALRPFVTDELQEDAAVPLEKLSKRQKQLLVLLDKGMSNRDIAESLQISEHTVKVHLWRLFRRLNVKSRSQASHLARSQGLL